MSALKTTTLLFKRLLQLDMSGSGPPWPLLVWNADTGAWEAVGSGPTLLGEQTAPSGGLANVTFADIPQTHSALEIAVLGRSTASGVVDSLTCQFNGDSDPSYYATLQGGDSGGSWWGGPDPPSEPFLTLGWLPGAGYAGNPLLAASLRTRIEAYNSTLWAKASTTDGTTAGGGDGTHLDRIAYSGWYVTTAPITSVTLALATGVFAEGSQVQLYGIS